MRATETFLQGLGGALIVLAVLDGSASRRVQPWHGLGVLCIAAGRALQAARELGWAD